MKSYDDLKAESSTTYKMLNNKYSIFIQGNSVDLCVPNLRAIEDDGWADWLNNIVELQATHHGLFPNHRSAQEDFLRSLANDRSKIVLLICEKKSNIAIGVISLQNISFQSKSAEIALSSSKSNSKYKNPFSALEAMALITQHGFDELGLNRIYAGQAYPTLSSWNKLLELIGFRSEGILRDGFVRGHKVEDIVSISCLYKNFLALKKIRGSLWGSSKIIRDALKNQPKKAFAEIIDGTISEMEREYYSFLFKE